MSKRRETPDVLTDLLGGFQRDIPLLEIDKLQKSQEPASEVVSVQWEYRLVTFQNYKGWRPRYVNGRELANWMDRPLIHEFIQIMGDDGWELAAASAGESMYGPSDSQQLYFKRPK
jgi:hypothetical protein